jgi:hypothetical protein
MENLNTIIKTAAALADIARQTQTFRFPAQGEHTFYLHADAGDVRIQRHTSAEIVITATLQVPVGWRIATDQDQAGVYFVALRRKLAASMAKATFFISVPQHVRTILRLEGANLTLESLHLTLEIPPGTSLHPLLAPLR